LGDPNLSLGRDPRTDPRLAAIANAIGLGEPAEPLPIDHTAPYAALVEVVAAAEPGFQALFGLLFDSAHRVDGVERSTVQITGADGNTIDLYIHRPTAASAPLPAVLHLHGGGMTILSATDGQFPRWRDELAAAGLIAIGVEFRNAGGALGPHPFPAGLDDCTSALDWVHTHRESLGISALVVSGESGGGNLTLATAIRANREGRIGQIDGIYAQCPYISGVWDAPPPDLPSLYENDDYFIGCGIMAVMAHLYDPAREHAANPLAWPYHAADDDLRGLPPTMISLNQLDPLRDEGLAFYRKLVAAGVPAASRTVNGTCHAGDLLFPAQMPEVYAASVRDLVGFANSLT
jgi:acetyl esterase/lipase